MAREVLEPAVLLAQPLEHGEVVDVELLAEEPGDLRRLSSVIFGSPTTMSPSIEAASGWPLRSRMSPRWAGSTTSTVPSAAAIAAYDSGVEPLQLHQPGPEQREHHRDHHEADPQPELR